MNMRKTSWILIAALVFCASAAIAQDQKQDTSPIDPNAPLQPLDTTPGGVYGNKPPVGVVRGANAPYEPETYNYNQAVPDQNTLAGAAPFTIGSLERTRNIFDPAISVSQIGQTVPDQTGKSVLTGVSVASASLNFNHTGSGYQFSTLYNGGETFNLGYGSATSFFGQAPSHSQFHNLSVSEQLEWARWHVLLRDDFMASPGAAFTGQGMGGPGLSTQFSSMLGQSLNSFAQAFQPSQTVNTGLDMRYQDTVLGQAEYSFSRRSAITFAGSYGLLHFTGTGYFNSTLMDAQAGYDYLLDPANSIAVLGSYGRINYTGNGTPAVGTTTVGTGNSTTDYVGALAYGRKITGRLAFQVAAGPQEIVSSGTAAGNFHILFASVNSALNYERRRSGLSLSVVRGLTGGSGVFLGATSNTVSGSAHYQFTRFWTGTVNGGYSINNSLAPAGVATTQFDNWFTGANLAHRVGPHAMLNLNYGASKQNSPATCLVTSCGGVGLQQTLGLSVNWHLRPAG
jgi:hypothetical protein